MSPRWPGWQPARQTASYSTTPASRYFSSEQDELSAYITFCAPSLLPELALTAISMAFGSSEPSISGSSMGSFKNNPKCRSCYSRLTCLCKSREIPARSAMSSSLCISPLWITMRSVSSPRQAHSLDSLAVRALKNGSSLTLPRFHIAGDGSARVSDKATSDTSIGQLPMMASKKVLGRTYSQQH